MCVETPQTLKTVSQVSSREVTNTTHLPHTDQLSTRALHQTFFIDFSKQDCFATPNCNKEKCAKVAGITNIKKTALSLYLVPAAAPIYRRCAAGERRGRQRGEERDVCDGVAGVCLLRPGNEWLEYKTQLYYAKKISFSRSVESCTNEKKEITITYSVMASSFKNGNEKQDIHVHIQHDQCHIVSFIYVLVKVAGLTRFSLCCHGTTHTARDH